MELRVPEREGGSIGTPSLERMVAPRKLLFVLCLISSICSLFWTQPEDTMEPTATTIELGSAGPSAQSKRGGATKNLVPELGMLHWISLAQVFG